MKKQRLLDLQEKAKNNSSDINDCIEILSEFFISQSQHNKDLKNELIALNNKIDSMNKKIDQILKFASFDPVAQILIENYEEDEIQEEDE